MPEPPTYRLHVHPWLRHFGRLLMPNWLAITVGRHVWSWRPMTERELEHELEHVRQWRRHGLLFGILYLLEGVRQLRAGRHWYRHNRFETAAREAASRLTPR